MTAWGSLRYWPPVALVTAFVVGAARGGVGGAVLAVTLAVLVVGPGYLIQQRVRRRRGTIPSGHGIDRDADDFFAGVAHRYLRVMRRHPALPILVAAIEVGGLAAIWLLLGRGWAEFVLVLTAVTFVATMARTRRR